MLLSTVTTVVRESHGSMIIIHCDITVNLEGRQLHGACLPAHVLQWNICSLSGELYMNSRLQICGFTTTGDARANLQAKELWSWVCFCGESTRLFLGSCPHILGTDMSKTCHIWWHFPPQGFTKKASNALGGSISQTQGFTGGKEWREWQMGTNPSDGVHFIHILNSLSVHLYFTLKQKIQFAKFVNSL